MAAVLRPEASGRGDPFWARAAVNLLAACALHYPTFGRCWRPGETSMPWPGNWRGARPPALALNIMAEAFNVGLAPWADPAVRRITSHTDLDLAAQLARVPTVLILRCAHRHSEAYGPYLGTVLRVLTSRLDDIGEAQANGQLPIPVGLALEESPALGRLDPLTGLWVRVCPYRCARVPSEL